MPKTYVAYNPTTDEMIASPCFKSVYNAALINLRYTGNGQFKIYTTTLDFDNYTYAQAIKRMTVSNLKCRIRLQKLSNYVKITTYQNSKYSSRIYLPKREPHD